MKNPYKEVWKKNEKKSYLEYVNELGKSSEATHLDTLAKINDGEKIALSRSGELGERLSNMGLSSSGYSEYLKAEALRKSDLAKKEASEELYIGQRRQARGYEEYLNNYEKLQSTARESFISKLTKEGIFDAEEALKLATASGLSEENAIIASAYGSRLAREDAMERAVRFARKNGLSSYSAKKYALAMGLGEREATTVSKTVSRLSEEDRNLYYSLDGESYFDSIKSMLESQEED